MEWNGEKYDAWYSTSLGSYVLSREVDLMVPHVKGTRILDAGCGTGRFVEELRRRGFDAIGIEPDPSMARVARKRVGDKGVQEMSIQEAPQLLGRFDTVVLGTVLQFVDDPTGTLRSAAELLEDGGRLVIGELHPDAPWNRWRREHNPFFKELRFIHPVELGAMAGSVGLRFVAYAEGVYLPAMDWMREKVLPFLSVLSPATFMVVLASLEKTALWRDVLRLPPSSEVSEMLSSLKAFTLEDLPHNVLRVLERVTPGPGAYYVGVFEKR